MERIGVLGTGMVGKANATRLAALGYSVMMGSRSADNPEAADWAAKAGSQACYGTFSDAAAFGELLILAVKGEAAVEVVRSAGEENLRGKTIIDITNPLDFSHGMPPTLFVCNTESLAERVQRAAPQARVVKSLNLVNADVQTDPGKAGGEPTMFVAGEDAAAKEEVVSLLREYGWRDIIDLGDLTGARAMEMLLPIWLRCWQTLQDAHVAFKMVRK